MADADADADEDADTEPGSGARAPARPSADTANDVDVNEDIDVDADDARDVPWLTASAIGQAAYCPYQLYLAHGGAVRDAAATAALRRGDTAHRVWNTRQRASGRSPRLVPWRRAIVAALVLAVGALAAMLVAVLVGR